MDYDQIMEFTLGIVQGVSEEPLYMHGSCR